MSTIIDNIDNNNNNINSNININGDCFLLLGNNNDDNVPGNNNNDNVPGNNNNDDPLPRSQHEWRGF